MQDNLPDNRQSKRSEEMSYLILGLLRLSSWKITDGAAVSARALIGASMRNRIAILFAFLALVLPVFAQEDAPPPPKKDGVQITFLPPPLEGTVSLGIYDGAGKLVRTLHREATQKDFVVGLNGFITRWDGRDDTGQPLPPGKYSARGWMVGDLAIEGVAFHCNDWMKGDDSPRITRVLAVKNDGRDNINIVLRGMDGKEQTLGWNLAKEGAEPPKIEVAASVADGKLSVGKGDAMHVVALGERERAVAASVGRGGNVWTIVESPAGREVRAYSAEGEFVRRLAYAKGEPAPKQIAASHWSETIFLLDENEHEQRLRSLVLVAAKDAESPPIAEGAGKEPVSTWKTVYQKRIVSSDTFAAVTADLGRKEPLQLALEVKVQTNANTLLQNAKTEIRLQAGTDEKGALLKTTDGLPLTHLSETPQLKWAALLREGDAFVLLQSDGVVVEEFKLGKPANMMAFDAGEYTLRAPAEAKK